ncbi:MAG: hypothetical protein P4N59_18575 [Negativicutes bacterium]|nr:hypothetical protein [Negativicutes bacterium]
MSTSDSLFRAGYAYAGTLCLDKLPLRLLIETLDAYKELAVESQSEYYHGMAKWMEEEVLRREVVAA